MATMTWHTLDDTGDTTVVFEPSPELVAAVEEVFADGKSDAGRFADADEAHGYALAQKAFTELKEMKYRTHIIPEGGTANDAVVVHRWEDVISEHAAAVIAVPQTVGG
jgi:hypothetical protein